MTADSPLLVLSTCTVDLLTREVLHSDGRAALLTDKQAGLLEYLVRHADRAVSRDELHARVWGCAGMSESDRATLGYWSATLLRKAGRTSLAETRLRAALQTFEASGEDLRVAEVRDALGCLLMETSRLPEAEEQLEAALEGARAAGSRRGEGVVLGNLANVRLHQGRAAEARSAYESALVVLQEVGDLRTGTLVLGNLGILDQQQGRPDDARVRLRAVLQGVRSLGDRRSEGIVLGNLASLDQQQGHTDSARRLFEQALAIHREIGKGAPCEEHGRELDRTGGHDDWDGPQRPGARGFRPPGDVRTRGIAGGSLTSGTSAKAPASSWRWWRRSWSASRSRRPVDRGPTERSRPDTSPAEARPMLTPWLLAIAVAAPPKVTLPPEHPKQAMRTSDDAQACAELLLDDIARKSCADGRCRATGRVKAHIGATLHGWCRAGYQPQQIRRAAAAQREALVNAPPPGPPVPEETLVRLDDGQPWVRPATPMVFAACDIVARPLVMQGVPAMQRIARTHPDLALVCVASERSTEQAAEALDGTEVPVLVDSNARWTRAAGIATFPTYLLVTADGFVADTLVGSLDEDRIAQFVAAEALE